MRGLMDAAAAADAGEGLCCDERVDAAAAAAAGVEGLCCGGRVDAAAFGGGP